MSSTFRALGLNYIEFSAIAAKCVRNSLKGGEAIEAAAKRSTGVVQVKHYADGVAGTPKVYPAAS